MSTNFQSYQAMPEEAQLQAQHVHSPVRIIDGALSVSSTDGVITETTKRDEHARSNEASPFHGQAGIFGTARNANGTPAMSIGDDTLLEFNGLQASAKMLAAAGVITRNPDGSYSEAGQQEAPHQQEKAAPMLTDAEVGHLQSTLDVLTQESAGGVIGAAIGFAAGRGDAASLVSKITQASGLPPEEAQARFDAAAQVYRGAAERAIAGAGVSAADADSFFAWCRDHKQGAMHEAISYMVHGDDASKWAPLARQWMSQAAPSMEALKAAGIPTRKSAHGATGAGSAVECYVRGQWMSVGAASRAGLL